MFRPFHPQHSATIYRFDRLPHLFLNCFGEAFGADQKAERAMAAAIFHLVVNRCKEDWYRLCQSPGQTGDTRHQLMWLNWFGHVDLKAGGQGAGAIFTAGAGCYRYSWRIASTVPHAPDQFVTAAAG